MTVVVADEVAEALASNRPVVALESTVYSTLGLPDPANRRALDRCEAAIRDGGAVPAITAVVDGQARVGLDRREIERVLRSDRKVAERDLAVAVALGWSTGVTTVSASLALTAAAGITVFATGGIGGVHRGAEVTGDISADLDAIAAAPVVTVCAGAKAFLDLARTLEYLETAGVPVLGYQTDRFPAFYVRDSGLRLAHRVETPAEVAAVALAQRSLGRSAVGVLLANPIPADHELDGATLDAEIDEALGAADGAGISGPAVTPFVLGRLASETDGRSIAANLALIENNCRVAAAVAEAAVS